jgi:hypothetical protein
LQVFGGKSNDDREIPSFTSVCYDMYLLRLSTYSNLETKENFLF